MFRKMSSMSAKKSSLGKYSLVSLAASLAKKLVVALHHFPKSLSPFSRDLNIRGFRVLLCGPTVHAEKWDGVDPSIE
jgi:hypothetical protein